MRHVGTLDVHPQGRLIIGGFGPRSPELDDGTAKRRDRHNLDSREELPFIPGSALRGALRQSYVRLKQGAQQYVCDACRDSIGEMGATRATDESTCVVCDLFGAASSSEGTVRSRLRVGDAELFGASRDAYLPERHLVASHHVSIDRRRRTRSSGRLFAVEALAAFSDLAFRALVELDAKSEEEWAELRHLVHATLHLGAAKTAGCGRVVMELEDDPHQLADIPDLEPRTTSSRVLLVQAEEPLCLGGDVRFDNYFPSQTHVSGQTLRGALAHALLRGGQTPETPLFRRSFVDQETAARFEDGFFDPGGGGELRPIPLTAFECKAHGDAHGIHDTLLVDLLAKWADLPHRARCPVCGSALVRVDGAALRGSGKKARVGAPQRVTRTRVAMSQARGRAARGLLYAQEQLPPVNLEFRAVVHNLDTAFDEVFTNVPIYLGKASSRGLGKIKIRTIPYEREPVAKRVKLFEDELEQKLRPLVADRYPKRRVLVPLLACSPWPLEPGQDTAQYLQSCLPAIDDIELEITNARATRRGGYTVRLADGGAKAWQLPLRSCLGPGSVLLMTAPEEQRALLLEALAAAEERGLLPEDAHEDRSCGFGALRIADSIHTKNTLLGNLEAKQ